MKLRTTRLAIPSLLLILVFSTDVPAQTTTSGELTGVVSDPSHAVVPDADVQVWDSAKGTMQTTITDREGVYRFLFLPPGRYTLIVTRNGFQEEHRTVGVVLGAPSSVNVTLEIMKGSTTVRVTGEAPLLNAENGDESSTMRQAQISEIPNPGNDLTYIAQTTPGAIMNTDGGLGDFSIFGMPGTSNTFTLNGMSYTGMGYEVHATGATGLLLGTNEVQEATIVSNGYSGQFGVLAGAAVSYITKSGGNDFHGDALYFWNGSALNANDWFNNATGVSRPFDNANQWAGSIGGPLKKDKLFFFFNSEGLHLLVPQAPQQVVLPSPQFEAATIANIDSKYGAASASDAFYKKIFALYNGTPGANRSVHGGFAPLQDPTGCMGFTFPNELGTTQPCSVNFETTLGRPTYESLVSVRVDWKIRPEDRIFILVGYDHGRQASSTDPISPIFNINSNQPWWRGQLVETHTFSPSLANQFLLAGWRLSQIFQPANVSQALAALPTLLAASTAGIFTNVGSNADLPSGFKFAQYQVSDDIVKIWGNHTLRFGANLLRDHRTELPGVDEGTLTPFTIDAFYQGGLDPATPATSTTLLAQSFTSQLSQPLSYYDLGFYAQQEWHARSNLSLTLALRAEHQSNPVCQTSCFARLAAPFDSVSHDPAQPYNRDILVNLKHAYQDLSGVGWAPRFSFAWQPLGVSHNTVLRGGIGIFYNVLPGGAAISMASNPPLFNQFNIQGDNIAPNETTSLFKDTANSNAEFLSGFAAGESFSEIAKVNGFSPPSLTSPDRVLKLPQYQKWSLEIQQAFGSSTLMSIAYVGNHGIHELILNPSANAYGFGTLPTGVCTSPPVPPCADPRFSEVTELTTAGVSNYNGMVISFEHRFTVWTHGIFQANYTYDHAFDEVSNGGLLQFTGGSSTAPQDPNNFRGSYGSADYDVRHSFNANYVWEIPVKAVLRGHGPDYVAKGWQISGTVFARTGFPYTVIDNQESLNLIAKNFFGPIYAVPVGPLPPAAPCGGGAAIPSAPQPCQPPQILPKGNPNPNALFVQTGCETGFNTGTLGQSGQCMGGTVASLAQGRNRFRNPNYFNTDFSIMKNTKIPRWENAALGIGFQFFNFFNHPNFGLPDNFISDSRFGQIYYTEGPPTGILGAGLGGDASARNIQLKVQLQF